MARALVRDGRRPMIGSVPPTLLLAEGDASVRGALADLLVEEGNVVRAVPDGRVARRAVAQCRPDLLVASSRLDAIDGVALAGMVREWHLPVVLLGADPAAPAGDGVVALSRPIDVALLLRLVAHSTGGTVD